MWGSIQRIYLEAQLEFTTSGAQHSSWLGWTHLEQTLLDNPVAEAVSNIVKQSEDIVGVHPAIGALLSTVRVQDLLPVLSTVCLESEEAVRSQVCLDVILSCKVLLA